MVVKRLEVCLKDEYKVYSFFFQGSASEATLVALLSARAAITSKLRSADPSLSQGQILDKLIAYSSEEVRSFVVLTF